MTNESLRTGIAVEALFLVLILGAALFGLMVPFPGNWFLALTVETVLIPTVTLRRLILSQRMDADWYEAISEYSEQDDPVLYASGQDELRFTKSMQWSFVYYILLIYGVLFGLALSLGQTPSSVQTYAKLVLYCLDVLTLAYGIYFVCELQYKLRNYRVQLDKSRFFRASFIENGQFNKEHCELVRRKDALFWRDPRITIVFLFSTVLGFLVVMLAVWDSLRNGIVAIPK